MSTKSRLCLLDGNGLLYRAFFAIKSLSTSAGRPTNAVYGFVRMIRQLRQKVPSTHMVVVFDGGVPSWRRELLPAYKAQRSPMPIELRSQFELVEKYLVCSGIPWVRMEGEEADDVIATLVHVAEGDGADIAIVTNDKDFFQLVNEATKVVLPNDMDGEITAEAVLKKTGVRPGQIVDWLALTGDSSDNIDGVPGIGSKTAAKLLEAYGNSDSIFSALESVTPDRIRKSLADHRAVVIRNREMIRLRHNLECALNWQTAILSGELPERLIPFFEEMEFSSLADELGRKVDWQSKLDFGGLTATWKE